jgi:hypothetical protein
VCWDDVPEFVQRELTLFNRANRQKNLVFTAELLDLLAIFKHKAIPITVFKGPVLAQSVYGDLSLREFSDVDILVHEEDLCKAEDILIARGYQADFPDRNFRSAFLRYQGQYAFRNRESGISIDLHWRLSGKGTAFPVQSEKVWATLGEVSIAGRIVPTLAHDDLVLFLAGHGTKEGWRSLSWVCDFAELLRLDRQIDWIALFERAQQAHCSRPLLLALLLASNLLDAPAPLELLHKARNDSAVRALEATAMFRMLSSKRDGELTEFLNELDAYDKLSQRLCTVVTLLTTRTVGDYRSMPLPKYLWGIYYFTRPFRLAGKFARLVLARSAETKVA